MGWLTPYAARKLDCPWFFLSICELGVFYGTVAIGVSDEKFERARMRILIGVHHTGSKEYDAVNWEFSQV